jgi:hypothetical protein
MAPPILSSLKSWKTNLKGNRTLIRLRAYLPPLNFITIHYTYFIVTCMVTSLIFWGASDPALAIGYTDSLFLVVSAMTEAGLNTVNLSQMTTFQQFLLWVLILIGGTVFVSIGTVLTRKRVFESRFKGLVLRQREGRGRRRSVSSVTAGRVREGTAEEKLRERKVAEPVDGSGFESRHSGPRDPTSAPAEESSRAGNQEGSKQIVSPGDAVGKGGSTESETTAVAGERAAEEPVDEGVRDRRGSQTEDRISFMRYVPSPPPDEKARRRVLSFVGVGAHPNSTAYKLPHTSGLVHRAEKKTRDEGEAAKDELDLSREMYPHYLTRRTTGRNAQFFGLTRAQREHLGGVEYRAITLLAWIVPIYFVLWQLLGCLGLAAYMAHNKAATARGNGINPW